MTDLITYTSDLEALRLELEEKESIKSKINARRIGVVYKDNTSVSLVRNCAKEIAELDNLEVIGECVNNQYKFKSGGKTKYESVYDVTPKTYTDEEGVEQTYTPPYMMGVIA